jgi:ribonuclease P protein component
MSEESEGQLAREAHVSDAGFGFPRSHRLTRGADLLRVRREGTRVRTEHIEVRALASLLSHPRVGFVVPKHKHGSVERNRLKRRLRELVRVRLLPVLSTLPALDVVLRPWPTGYEAKFEALERDVARAVGALVRASSVERRASKARADAPAVESTDGQTASPEG